MTLIELLAELIEKLPYCQLDAEVHLDVRLKEPDGAGGMLRNVVVGPDGKILWLAS